METIEINPRMERATTVSNEVRDLRLLNSVAASGGILRLPKGCCTVTGETPKEHVTRTLYAVSLSVLRGIGEEMLVLLEEGFSVPWNDLTGPEQQAIMDNAHRPWWKPSDIDDLDKEELRRQYLLRRANIQFINEHGDLEEEDFRKMDTMRQLIENARVFPDGERRPLVGDTVQGAYYQGRHPFENGLLDTPYPWQEDGDLVLCAHPYVPFCTTSKSRPEGYSLSTSGGPFFHIKAEHLEYDGKEERLFTVWGHDGACANGTLRFPVTVNRWRLSPEAGI